MNWRKYCGCGSARAAAAWRSAQAAMVRDALVAAHGLAPEACEIVPIRKTSGDRIQGRARCSTPAANACSPRSSTRPFSRRIDFAVHSAKDVPTLLPRDPDRRFSWRARTCAMRWCHRRARSRAFPPARWSAPPRFGVRRCARLRPDFRSFCCGATWDAVETRRGGNRCDDPRAAGLKRLGLEGTRHAARSRELSAGLRPGSACDRVPRRRRRMARVVAAIVHAPTRSRRCERAFLAALDGSCRAPIGGYKPSRAARASRSRPCDRARRNRRGGDEARRTGGRCRGAWP